MSPEAVIFGFSTPWRPDAAPQDEAWCQAVLEMSPFQHSLGSLCFHCRASALESGGESNLGALGDPDLCWLLPGAPGASEGFPLAESSTLLRGWQGRQVQAREVCVQKLSPLGGPLCLGASGQSG